MEKLKVKFRNCYGIRELDYEFDFSVGGGAPKAYSIYAPNGLMKTSFAKTFEALSAGASPKEERYSRPVECVVSADGVALLKESIFVVRSEIDISSDSPAITDILVNPARKARYDEIVVEIERLKARLIAALQRVSRVKKSDVEKTIVDDWGGDEFPLCIEKCLLMPLIDDLGGYDYGVLFDPKVTDVLQGPEFIAKAKEFSDRYQDLFNREGTIYERGVFNPAKAETSFSALERNGFFSGGHKVHLKGDAGSIDKAQLDEKLKEIHAKIDGDDALKKLREDLARNAQVQALTELIERLPTERIEFLLGQLMPENRAKFKQALWAYYVKGAPDAGVYLDAVVTHKAEIAQIEVEAAGDVPRWVSAVSLFNDRFVDMPFVLSIENQAQAVLGKEGARLKFVFKDGEDRVEWSRAEVKTLSQGEKRAIYLLSFIFEVEARKLANKETLFIVDDVADSFDYKNKHAIVQYLRDLTKNNLFHQIILTHNFDFFRALATNFLVHRARCLMANRVGDAISLQVAEGVNNYFIGKWKNSILTSDCILCATIPFVRNLIEYTKGDRDQQYLKLTSLLHWKSDTEQISVGEYFHIYNETFGFTHDVSDQRILKDLLFQQAEEICGRANHDGLNLEDKVLMSIAIRLKAERFMIDFLRIQKGDPNYWCNSMSQFGALVGEVEFYNPPAEKMQVLEKVSVTVSSNIHLNSFMYEPILDLTIDHLIRLYRQVDAL